MSKKPKFKPFTARDDNTTDLGKGAKFDDKKLRYDLLPISAIEELAYIYTVGAYKYTDRNWEGGFRWGRSFAAVIRHLFAFWKCEDKDSETGAWHLAQVCWNALALLHFALHPKQYGQWDDRPQYSEKPKHPEERIPKYAMAMVEAHAKMKAAGKP